MSEQPNILLITTDQQRFDTIHAAGNPYIRTPHLNWLSDRGVRFSRCYSDAPVCVPARATIMTGRTGYRNNLYMYCAAGASELLFDLAADPYEQHDLAGDSECTELKLDLKNALVAEIAAVRPEYLPHGQLPVSDTPDLAKLRGAWPGFISREYPEDVLH